MISMRLLFLRHIYFFLACLAVTGFQSGCKLFTQEYYAQEIENTMGRYRDQIFPATSDAGKKILHAWKEYNTAVSDYLDTNPKPDYVMMRSKYELYLYYPRNKMVIHFTGAYYAMTTEVFKKKMDSDLQQKLLGAMQ